MAMRAAVFRTKGRTCWHCGHDGADQVHHLVSPLVDPRLAYAMHNLVPVHGSPRNRCPECAAAGETGYCNQLLERKRPVSASPVNGHSGRVQRRQADADRAAINGAERKPAPSTGVRTLPTWATDVQDPDEEGTVYYRCDQPEVRLGRVINATPGSGCRNWHRIGGPPGRCF